MAIIATLNFGFALIPNFNLVQRLFHLAVFGLSFLAIFRSDARQGLVSGAVGIGTIFIIYVHSKYRRIGWIFAFSAFLIGIFSIFGMLQKGPLQSLLYKDSVSVRGYYWRAGIEMFRDNFLFGIGQDRYGAFFKAYREPKYSLTYGFDITSVKKSIRLYAEFNAQFRTRLWYSTSVYCIPRKQTIRNLFLFRHILHCTFCGIPNCKSF
jgi:O-antigen ligase